MVARKITMIVTDNCSVAGHLCLNLSDIIWHNKIRRNICKHLSLTVSTDKERMLSVTEQIIWRHEVNKSILTLQALAFGNILLLIKEFQDLFWIESHHVVYYLSPYQLDKKILWRIVTYLVLINSIQRKVTLIIRFCCWIPS